MTHTSQLPINHEAIASAVEAILDEVSRTVISCEDGGENCDSIITSVHGALGDLAARAAGPIHTDLVLGACRALGQTLGHTIVVNQMDDWAGDRLIQEEIDDLVATAETICTVAELRSSAADGVRLHLDAAARRSPVEVDEGMHHPELFSATASAIALVASGKGSR